MRRRPNVLVLMTDQHRADLMSCAGNDTVQTPNMDRIARRGVRFENAYAPYPVCVASRMAMLTGQYAHGTGVIDNTDRLPWRVRTVAHHFNSHGYLTGLIGKMHFCDAMNHGFEHYLSINDWLMYLGPKVRLYADEIASHPLSEHFFRTVMDSGAGFNDVEDLWEGPSPWVGHVTRRDFGSITSMASRLEAKDHLDAFVAREAAKFVRRHRDEPFFLIAGFMKPHTPFFPPAEYAERHPIDDVVLPEPGNIEQYPPKVRDYFERHLRIPERRRKAGMAGYRGNLEFVDCCVGRVHDALEEEGLLEDTIVVYTSDHGEMHGAHGAFQKFCLFEPAVKVPLIVSRAGRLPAGEVSGALTEYFGLLPTLAELTGTEIDEAIRRDMDSLSFADLVRRPELPGPDAVFSEFGLRSRHPSYMIRTKPWKYVYHQDMGEELYNLDEDPGENANLAAERRHSRLKDDLQRRLFEWYHPDRNRFRAV